ncbi:ThuA domain-containing protein [Streptomyces alanosinicus]|uniref:ThuA-like domain-containing protein n=1 Tax=Streptomyces alanosinicus TaxID=68171 RepID=A0A919D1F9_9ACTN|nr:ThuA domain-containing protein [Streptomyces alanosinicus]GHE03258.1 hypothetical protein GCM10010339_29960 [Streptomyces alanosinicus]
MVPTDHHPVRGRSESACSKFVQCVDKYPWRFIRSPGHRAWHRPSSAKSPGLAGWHGGIVDCFHDHGYHLLTGGTFVMHPPGFHDHTVHLLPERADHPVVAGLDDFSVRTEQYWVLTDPHIDVLATTVFPPDDLRDRPAVMPAVWTRTWGAGRVFSTIGHKPDDFDVPEVRTLTERGLLWASR